MSIPLVALICFIASSCSSILPTVQAQASNGNGGFAHLVVFNNNEEEASKTCSEFDFKRVTDAIVGATTNTSVAATSTTAYQPLSYPTFDACNVTVPSIHAALDRFITERSLATPCLSLLGSMTNLTSRRVECVPTTQDCDVSYVSLYTLPTSLTTKTFLLSSAKLAVRDLPRDGTKICLPNSRTTRIVTFSASTEFFYGDVHFSLSHTPPPNKIRMQTINWPDGQAPYFMFPNFNTTKGYTITGLPLLLGSYTLTVKASYAPDVVTTINFSAVYCTPGVGGV